MSLVFVWLYEFFIGRWQSAVCRKIADIELLIEDLLAAGRVRFIDKAGLIPPEIESEKLPEFISFCNIQNVQTPVFMGKFKEYNHGD